MDGIILIDKPAGISSFGVVAKVRRLLSQHYKQKIKLGHAGTLDPFATGLLILLCGKYTKLAGDFLKLDKSYRATLLLGKTSSTQDPEGDIEDYNSKIPTKAEIQEALNAFLGTIKQTPPIYSAIKINGQRAYKLARKGQSVQMSPREVKIYSIGNVNYQYPELSFDVAVSSGTYIRSLAEDIGVKLGTGAYLTALRRTAIDQYSLSSAVQLDKVNEDNIASVVTQLTNK